jgi:acyl phosphate:glycerol-3-phosphate acyltransferase
LLILEAFVLSYLIGSLPTAYIVVKRRSRIDIRSAGSGNVGTLNAYEVTGERLVGLVVLAVDVLKGSFAVLLTARLWGSTSDALSASLVGVVVGHCFPVWLKFRGGRGLAAAAGAMLVVSWIFVAMWLVCWFVGYSFSKNIHFGNIVAIVASPLMSCLLPKEIILKFTIEAFSAGNILIVYCLMSSVLFIRHIGPLRELISSRITDKK